MDPAYFRYSYHEMMRYFRTVLCKETKLPQWNCVFPHGKNMFHVFPHGKKHILRAAVTLNRLQRYKGVNSCKAECKIKDHKCLMSQTNCYSNRPKITALASEGLGILFWF